MVNLTFQGLLTKFLITYLLTSGSQRTGAQPGNIGSIRTNTAPNHNAIVVNEGLSSYRVVSSCRTCFRPSGSQSQLSQAAVSTISSNTCSAPARHNYIADRAAHPGTSVSSNPSTPNSHDQAQLDSAVGAVHDVIRHNGQTSSCEGMGPLPSQLAEDC